MAEGLFAVEGRSWSDIARSAYRSLRETVLGGGPRPAESGASLTSSNAAVNTDALRAAGSALRGAFDKLSSKMRPVYGTTLYSGQSSSAMLHGTSARVARVEGYSILETTAEINTRTSTVRSSSSALGLDVTSAQSASTIQSTAEMNAGFDTSYGSSSLTFTGSGLGSTSTGTLTGTYTGVNTAANATSLTVTLKNTNLTMNAVTATNVKFDVLDQDSTVLFSYDGNLTAGEQVYLGGDIGLSISFSSGTLRNTHEASTTVSKTAITVDASAAFNAGAGAPRFEGGATVSAGTFQVNGSTITVDANDTINSVLSKINSAGAGVTAAVANDRITLTSTGYSEDSIVLGNDTTGFLAATKLAAAATSTGNVRDDQQVFSKTTQFNDVVDGSFTINGVSISVDEDTDSLSTVISRINSSGAGVTASYDSATDKVVLTPDVAGATLTVGSDTSGFLSEAKIASGTEGTQANASGAFNATGASGPLLDSGFSVQAGSFTVNGVTISVAADDSINSVLAKITASAAGVDATYDAATETVTLTSRDFGADPITVGNDTSGFLAAVKLDGTANSTTGEDASAFEVALGDMAEYASVSAGTLTVNGQAITVDPSTTTIESLVAAIDGLTNVSASVDEATGAITINSALGGSVSVSDTSGILGALGLTAGTYSGAAGETTALRTQVGTAPANTPAVVDEILKTAEGFNKAVGELPVSKELLQSLIDDLQKAGIAGVSVSTDGSTHSLSIDRDALERALDSVTKPADTRAAVGSAIDAFMAKASELAAASAPAAVEPPKRSMTVELAAMPRLEVRRSEPAAAKTSASREYEETDWTAPRDSAGVFKGLFDELF